MLENEANKLLRKLQKVFVRQHTMSVALALGTIMEDVLEQMPDETVRYQVAMKLIEIILFGAAFNGIQPDQSIRQFTELASIPDNDLLTVAILGKIKGLIELCIKQWEQNRRPRDIALLRQAYNINSTLLARPMGKLGRQFDDTDQKNMFDVFIKLTTDMTDSIVDSDERNRFAFAVLQRLCPPVPASAEDLDNMKIVIDMLKDMPDPEVRNRGIIALLRTVLYFADSELTGAVTAAPSSGKRRDIADRTA